MNNTHQRGEQIRQFILTNIDAHPKDISKVTSTQFNISRQAVNKHLQLLVKQNLILAEGSKTSKTYSLYPSTFMNVYQIEVELKEDRIWDTDIKPFMSDLPRNVIAIWFHGFTEMMNNAIDHSSGKKIIVQIRKTATKIRVAILDDGEGIFKKIQTALNLDDEKDAIIELAKGKLTTDPAKHSGEGIFFTSRMFDEFSICSGNTYFSHKCVEPEDWILDSREAFNGTTVVMTLNSQTERTAKEIFDKFSSEDGEYSFDRTVIPVELVQKNGDDLISRSQAKRLLMRVDKFTRVVFDFANVEMIGQAFADEIFRVFRNRHPEISISHINSNLSVSQMIRRAENSNI
jgi:anti-sigma regulatory factor (Ser/Thr protein kinase)